MKSVTLKVGGPHEVIWEISPLFLEPTTWYNFLLLPNLYGQALHNRHLVIREKTPPNLGILSYM
jgi:hypothetical protein